MHPLNSGGYQPLSAGYSGLDAASPPPGSVDQTGSPNQDPSNGQGGNGDVGQNGGGGQPQYTDINQILDQILNITDQSLDEAQGRRKLNRFMRQAQPQPSALVLSRPANTRSTAIA